MGIHLKVLIFYYLVVGNSEFLIADGNSSFILNGKGMESTCEYFCNPAFEISSYVPPTFTENFPPRILSQNYTVPPGKSYVVLKWTEPIATDQHGKKARIEQVAGVKNGGKFNGSVNGQRHQIVYIATDKNGLKNSSSFVKYVSIPKCPELDVVKNGQYRCTDGRAPDSSCMFTCNKGYLLNEIENITCEHTALQPSWSGSRRCEKINCREPAVPENAKISCANGGYGYQSVCLVQCNQGYTPSGPLYMICKSDGYWSKETHCLRNTVLEFQCSPVQCNGHTCKQTPEQEIQCNCSNGWSGQRCEQPPDYCRNNICMNNGKCNNRYLAYNCTCPNTYSGVLCQISPVDGNWSDWTSWSSCSRTCGSGSQTRFRLCDSPPPSPSGEFCPGKETDSKPCKISNCNVCPPLKQYNDSRSTYDCEVYNNYGQERCQIVCEEGTMLLPQFKQFSEIICGWSTNYIWIPANIQPSCVVSVPPKGFLLETKILYNEVIPVELENTFKVEVLTNLKPTDCFRPSMIKCETSVRNRIGSVQSQMDITFKIVLESDDSSSVKEARHILERTADYIKDYISEIFDISLGQTVFKSDKKSFSISTSSECEKGSVPYDGMCVLCPVGTSASNGRCEICEKGFYQNKKEQTKCEPCPAGKTTIQPGAIQPFECFEPKENSFEKAMDVVKVVVSVVSSIVTVIGAVATFLTVKKICCKKCKKNGEGENAEAQNTQSDARHQDQELQLLNSSDRVNTVDPDNHIESN